MLLHFVDSRIMHVSNWSFFLPNTYRIGFDSFTRQQQFRTYVNYVILPSYELHQEMGLLQYTMSGEKLPEIMPFRNFLSGRLLWDEAMATNAMEWTRKNPGGLIVGLVGADHGTVTFFFVFISATVNVTLTFFNCCKSNSKMAYPDGLPEWQETVRIAYR